MAETVPPRVRASADAAGFGPLVAGIQHPNGRLFAVVSWMYFAPVAGLLVILVGTVVLFLAGRGSAPNWWVALVYLLVGLPLAVFLARQAVGNVTRRAFYLYPQGYIATKPSGRVFRTIRWQDVAGIDGIGAGLQIRASVIGTKPRAWFAIQHLYGRPRPIKFSEVVGREVLAPLAHQLHTQGSAKVIR